ncbi:hypothetical protein DFH09DRAFT_297510 [Mycena vulgaris]|nr:hypothetical protein DFH09DRAFT_297510 [Mycena vulgaris]
MDNDATLALPSSQLRQKRVLPSRSRRGGPGVGNCDVDVMILNAQLNKTENEPLIPAETLFVMKTNDTLEKVAKEFSSASGSGLNLRAHESYFDRPEVLKAYRDQTIIETPEYTNVADIPSVGGRLRVRSSEENNLDTDAVYEKRHRKYESFEKRQRLREKEKLKHEQYKLKERIEQLRGMDNSAFLAAPASSFSPRPGVAEVLEEDNSLLGGLNGNPAYIEGERRRKEMLMNAQTLEERYRVLLPPDRQRKPAGQNSMHVSTDPELELSAKDFTRPHDDVESELDEDYLAHVPKRDSQKLKLKLPARPHLTPTITTSKAPSTSSKKRRRSLPPPLVPPPPPKSPAAAARRSRLGPEAPPLVIEYQIGTVDEPGPSSLHLLPNSQPLPESSMPHPDMDVIPSLRFMQYDPEADNQKLAKQGREPRKRKRAKTEERGLPETSRDYSVPLQTEPFIIVDDDSAKRSSSPIQDAPLSYSYPPPAPPDHYSRSPETSVPPGDASPPLGPISRMETVTPEPHDYYTSLGPPSPPHADEPFTFPNSSVPPAEPIAVDRKPSVPPIESISAPVNRRGRSRVVVPKAPRKAPTRPKRPCDLVTVAVRTSKNPRQLERSRHLIAFGVKLPPILHGSDSYDFELPPEASTRLDFNDETEDPDVSREVEGSQGPDERDEDLDTDPDDTRDLEAVDDPEDEDDSDKEFDGT